MPFVRPAEDIAGRVLRAAPVYSYGEYAHSYRVWPREDIESQLRRFFGVLGGDNWYKNHGWDTELPFEPPPPPPEFNETNDMELTSTAIFEHVRVRRQLQLLRLQPLHQH